jgi:hypothetical protein
MAQTLFDVRQALYRNILQQIFPYLTGKTLDLILSSIDQTLTLPLNVDATNPASLVVNVGPAIVSNTESLRNRSLSFIGTGIPTFTGGTVTFPAASGGNITTSTGGSVILTLPSGNYCQVLLSMDSSGDLITTPGGASPTLAGAQVPAPPGGDTPFAYVTLQNIAGTIQNVAQADVYQLMGSGGGSGSSSSVGFAQSVPLTINTTTVNVTFPSALAGVGYVVNAMMANTIDPNPQFQPVDITAKTVNGFTATWDGALDSSNYSLYYVVPAVQSQIGEAIISNGATDVLVTLPVAMASTSYVVTANMVNLVDVNPQFQQPIITNQTTTTFTASWNNAADTGNYKLAYNVAVYQ